MSNLTAEPVSVNEARARLLVTVLPAEALALLAAGQHIGHVGALYAPEADAAERALVEQLRARTGFNANMTPDGFLHGAEKVLADLHLSHVRLFDAFVATAYLAAHFESHRRAVAAVISAHYVLNAERVYHAFARAIEILGWFVSTSFTPELNQEQVDMLAALSEFWFTVVEPERAEVI